MAGACVHRLFFAVWPEPAAQVALQAQIERLAGTIAARWVKPARRHLTLAFLATADRFPENIARRAMRAAAEVRASTCVWHADTIRGFHASRPPCVLTSHDDTLRPLHEALLDALRRQQVALDERRPWVPHVTLGYASGHAIRPIMIAPLAWPVTAFALLHSVGGESAYRELGRWPLTV